MQKELCDKCGKEITTIERWRIGLRFVSSWIPNGDTRLITLCGKCGWKAARLLGFAFDTGKILSCAREEYVTDATVCGANGGGMLVEEA